MTALVPSDRGAWADAYRLLGYILLVGGFAWLIAGVFYVRPVARAIVVRSYSELGSQESFTREQVQRYIREPVFALVDAMPPFAVPSVLMLLGGVCLDRLKRK